MRLAKFAIPISILLVVGLVAWKLVNPNAGTLALRVTPSNAVVKLDGKTIDSGSRKLSPARYTLEVTADGYIGQIKTVTITKGKTIDLTIDLAKKTTANLVESIYRNAIYKNEPNVALTVLATRELDGGTWIVGGFQSADEPSLAILKKDSSADGYSLYLVGPPFNPDTVAQLPGEVQALVKNDAWLGVQ